MRRLILAVLAAVLLWLVVVSVAGALLADAAAWLVVVTVAVVYAR